MKHHEIDALRPKIEKFVADLNGRYREHCSDTMLVALLFHSLYKVDSQELGNALYQGSIWIFENVLEGGCKAHGNGHHVAQNFVKAITS